MFLQLGALLSGLVAERLPWGWKALLLSGISIGLIVGFIPCSAFAGGLILGIVIVTSRARFVGLTGGIASGKSTVSRQLVDGGALVVDADIIAKQALQPNSWAWRRLKQRVSPQLWQSIVDHEGNIRRAELRQQMFQDSNLRHALNSATHLPIIVEILKQLYWNRIFHPTKLVVLDAPLLLETRLDWMCHTVLVVACNPEQQIERVMARDGVDHEQASNALNSQMALQDKLQRASVVLDNTQSIDLLHKQVATWLVNAQRVW